MKSNSKHFIHFLTFPACFSIPTIFSNLNLNCSNLSSLRNLQEKNEKTFCYQKLFGPFTVWINCSSDLKNFANSRPSASNFKSFSRSLEQFFLIVGQDNVGNKIPNATSKISINILPCHFSFQLIVDFFNKIIHRIVKRPFRLLW